MNRIPRAIGWYIPRAREKWPFSRGLAGFWGAPSGSAAGLWRLLLTLQQQPPQTGATALPFGATGA
eukprot:COSAG02_NODE_530_length_20697_cov_20.103457_11_plen_66_part_00